MQVAYYKRQPMPELRLMLEAHGITTVALAQSLGCSHSGVSRVLSGERAMPGKWPKEIARLLGERVEDVVSMCGHDTPIDTAA